VSSSTTDADLFLIFRVFTPDIREVVFQAPSTRTPRSREGWLRAPRTASSIPKVSREYRPYTRTTASAPEAGGSSVPLDIELWPTSIVVPAGHRIALTVRGRDYEWGQVDGRRLSNSRTSCAGCGPFLHNDPRRPARRRVRGQEHAGTRPPSTPATCSSRSCRPMKELVWKERTM